MTDAKSNRHRAIAEILREGLVRSQDDIAARLASASDSRTSAAEKRCAGSRRGRSAPTATSRSSRTSRR